MNTVELYGISDNMSAFFQNVRYGATNNADPTIMGYYVVKFLLEPYMLQDKKTVDKQVIKVGKIIVKAEYLSIMKTNTNWYWQ